MADIKGYIPNLGQNSSITINSSDIDPKVVQYTQVVLTNAQVLALDTAPLLLIGTPTYLPLLQGSGNVANVVTDFSLTLTAGTAYAAGGSTIGLTYGGTATYITNAIGTSIFYSTGSAAVYASPLTTYTVVPNTGVYLANSTANFTTGTGTVTANVWYAQIQL